MNKIQDSCCVLVLCHFLMITSGNCVNCESAFNNTTFAVVENFDLLKVL